MASTSADHSGTSIVQGINQPRESLQAATDKKDWFYKLRLWEIQVLGIYEFELPNQSFFVGNKADLQLSLERYLEAATRAHEDNEADPYIFIVNVEDKHWSALVIFEGRVFYADSLKLELSPLVLHVLTANSIKDIVVVSVDQQLCDWNSGFWALINAKVIATILKQKPNSNKDDIKEYLRRLRVPGSEYGKFFRNQRRKSVHILRSIPKDGTLMATVAAWFGGHNKDWQRENEDDIHLSTFDGPCRYSKEDIDGLAATDVDHSEETDKWQDMYVATPRMNPGQARQDQGASLFWTGGRTEGSSSLVTPEQTRELEHNIMAWRRSNARSIAPRSSDRMFHKVEDNIIFEIAVRNVQQGIAKFTRTDYNQIISNTRVRRTYNVVRKRIAVVANKMSKYELSTKYSLTYDQIDLLRVNKD